MKPYKIDEIGEGILEILTRDAKISNKDISKQLNITEESVAKYIKNDYDNTREILKERATQD